MNGPESGAPEKENCRWNSTPPQNPPPPPSPLPPCPPTETGSPQAKASAELVARPKGEAGPREGARGKPPGGDDGEGVAEGIVVIVVEIGTDRVGASRPYKSRSPSYVLLSRESGGEGGGGWEGGGKVEGRGTTSETLAFFVEEILRVNSTGLAVETARVFRVDLGLALNDTL